MEESTRKIYEGLTKKQLIDAIDDLWKQRDLVCAMLLDEYVPTKKELLDCGMGRAFISDLNRKGLTDKYLDVL